MSRGQLGAAGDFALCDAVENAPAIWKGKPDTETLEQLNSEQLAVEEPQLSEEVRDLSAAIADCENVLGIVEDDLRIIGGVPKDDGIEAVAHADAT